jgi:excinuclease UvrABC nuclease subunit
MSFHIQNLKHNFTEIDIPLDNNISGIYLLKNNYNQETYIGASTDIKHRVYRHFSVFF